jgi:hypothetical protein
MPRYHYWFRLAPRWIFGLSEPGKVILPAGGPTYTGPVIDARTGNFLTPGTESVLRKLEDQVNVDLTVTGASVSFADDVLRIAIEAASPEAAIQPVTDLLNGLLPMVSFGLGQLISVALIQATNDAGVHVRFRMETIELVGFYNLALVREALHALPNQLERAAQDSKLSTAVLYFAKGLALEPLIVTERWSAVRPLGVGTALLASEVFLNYWKVVETVLGTNPTNAAFRRRCAKLGILQAYIEQELQPLFDLRDAADVAHAQRAQAPVGLNEAFRMKAAAQRVLGAALSPGAAAS